jgi:glycosyltransferase involved in cell wall biosynthesis
LPQGDARLDRRYEQRRPIRVLWLLKEFAPGGAERLLLEIQKPLEGLVEFHPGAVTNEPRSLEGVLVAAGFEPVFLGARAEPDLSWLPRLRSLVRTLDPDLVHLHLPYPGAMGRLGMVGLDLPIVYTEHSLWNAYHPLTRWVNALTYARNDAVIAVSQKVAATILSSRWGRAIKDRLFVVANGIDTGRVRREADLTKSVPGIEPGPGYGVVGHLRVRKGIDILLRAAPLIRAAVPQARGYVVGVGEEAAALRNLKLQLAAESVSFLGLRPDARAIIQRMDVFVVPSRVEGLPIALLEAMALGRPIVATSVGGIPSVLSHGADALLVPPESPEALASAIIRLLREPELGERLGKSAQATVQDRFSSEATSRRHLQIYRWVLGKRRQGTRTVRPDS